MTKEEEGEPWEYWRSRAIAAEITMRQITQASRDTADEIKQAHDDLDALYVQRDRGGLPLSIAGRILLLAGQREKQ